MLEFEREDTSNSAGGLPQRSKLGFSMRGYGAKDLVKHQPEAKLGADQLGTLVPRGHQHLNYYSTDNDVFRQR